MRFEVVRAIDGELGAPIEDVAQEAIDATATAYTTDAAIDVDEQLRVQLHARGVVAGDGGRGRGVAPRQRETTPRLAPRIRSGHHVPVGRPDGSMEVSRDRSRDRSHPQG